MPFITEELWHALYDGQPPAKSIALTRYPQADEKAMHGGVESGMADLQELIVTTRALRKDLEVPEREEIVLEVTGPKEIRALAEENSAIIGRLARVSSLKFHGTWVLPPTHSRTTAKFTLGFAYKKAIDVDAERERLNKELAKHGKNLVAAEQKLANDTFLAKAPAPIIEGLRQQAAETRVLYEKTRAALDELESQAAAR